jgi:hypothetical protein
MKKKLSGLLLALLLLGTLGACGPTLSDEEAYHAMGEALDALTEFHVTGEVSVLRLDVDASVMNHSLEGFVSLAREEVQMTYFHRDEAGVVTHETEVIIVEGRAFTDFTGRAQYVLDEFFARTDVDPADAARTGLMQGNTLLETPAQHLLSARLLLDHTPYFAFAAYTSRAGDTFTTTIEGEAVFAYAEDFMPHILFGGGFEFGAELLGLDQEAAMPMLLDWFRDEVDFSDARLTITRTHAGDRFSLHTDLTIPDAFEARQSVTLSPQAAPPAERPAGPTVSAEEYMEHLNAAIIALMLGTVQPEQLPTAPLTIEVVHDLEGFSLLDHDLPADGPLEAFSLAGGDGQIFQVSILRGPDFSAEGVPGGLIQEGPGFMLAYELISRADDAAIDIIEVIRVPALMLLEAMQSGDAEFAAGPLRVAPDNQSAALIMSGHILGPMDQRVLYFLAQALPDSDYLLFLMMSITRLEAVGEPFATVMSAFAEMQQRHLGIDIMSPLLG